MESGPLSKQPAKHLFSRILWFQPKGFRRRVNRERGIDQQSGHFRNISIYHPTISHNSRWLPSENGMGIPRLLPPVIQLWIWKKDNIIHQGPDVPQVHAKMFFKKPQPHAGLTLHNQQVQAISFLALGQPFPITLANIKFLPHGAMIWQ